MIPVRLGIGFLLAIPWRGHSQLFFEAGFLVQESQGIHTNSRQMTQLSDKEQIPAVGISLLIRLTLLSGLTSWPYAKQLLTPGSSQELACEAPAIPTLPG